jgi:DHA1 family tetracycline resistance protein-like MFS transporter
VTDHAPSAPPRRAAAFGFVFATALMNAVSFGIMIPILPNLIKQFVGGDTAAASEWNVIFSTVWGFMQFVCGPLLGMLSDRFGRRPVLLLSIFGLFGDFLFMYYAPSLAWLFVGRVLNGVTASSFATTNAYVADITAPDRRARNFGMLGSAFGFGFIIGPTIGGLLGEYGLRVPFIVAAGLCLINALYGLLVLPESLPPERRAPGLDWRRANPLGSLAFLRQSAELTGLVTVGFLFQLGFTVLPSIFVLYSGYRYGWTPAILGFTFMATGVAQIVVQMFLVGPVVRRVGERGAVLLGLGMGALGLMIYALAPTGPLYLVGVPIWAMSGFTTPGLQGLMTGRVGPRNQGQLQGVNQSLQGVSSVIGPPLFGLTFAWAVRNDSVLHLPGLPILISSALLLTAFVLSLRVATPSPAAAVAA